MRNRLIDWVARQWGVTYGIALMQRTHSLALFVVRERKPEFMLLIGPRTLSGRWGPRDPMPDPVLRVFPAVWDQTP